MTSPVGVSPGDTEERECATCQAYLHSLALECDCSPGRYVCLLHCDTLCECEPSSWRLLYRYDLGELQALMDKVTAQSGVVRGDRLLAVAVQWLYNGCAQCSRVLSGSRVCSGLHGHS